VVQSFRSGETRVVEVPVPQARRGEVLVRVAASVVSAGTERMAVEFAGKSLVQKARARPDLARQVLDKARREGMLTALQAARQRLDRPLALGYASAGTVIAVGERVGDLRTGDRVACAGSGHAVHAEVVAVPRNLIVPLPAVSPPDLESAAFAALGAIALHGVRLADTRLGDVVAVIGLGLVGQLAVQLLRAAGCRVVGMEVRAERAALAARLGTEAVAPDAETMRALCRQRSGGHGVDAVLITAETPSHEPVTLAGELARDRGIVVAVGAVGMSIPRRQYYEKELDFRVSRSYGPGRYDPDYEEGGRDYPIGYVRWTENRNMEAFVRLLASGQVDVASLVTHRVPIERATSAYDLILGKTGEPFLGVLITYPERPDLTRRIALGPSAPVRADLRQPPPPGERVRVGLLGAGSFATGVLMPALRAVSRIDPVSVCSAGGVSARHAAEKFGFRICTTDEREVLEDPGVDTVVVATRHHLHARQVMAALEAGKHVFCEKPLALSPAEVQAVVQAYREAGASRVLTVGYNRRFAPMARALRDFVAGLGAPLVAHYRVNAGELDPTHWQRDPEQGGGRIIGEVCHFVDFLTFLTGALPVRVAARTAGGTGATASESVVITIEFADGSVGGITYATGGDRAYPKERVEVFGGGAAAVLDDFRRLELTRHGRRRVRRAWLRQDKGHRGEWEAFVAAVLDGAPAPIPLPELVAGSLATFAVVEALGTGSWVTVETVAAATPPAGS
jgi:predicted dehydrogenase